jgi:hypothetical protein
VMGASDLGHRSVRRGSARRAGLPMLMRIGDLPPRYRRHFLGH